MLKYALLRGRFLMLAPFATWSSVRCAPADWMSQPPVIGRKTRNGHSLKIFRALPLGL